MLNDPVGIAILSVIGLGALLIYLLPAVVAFVFNHRDKHAIAALDILLGWSLIGWVVALVWSMTDPPKR